MSGVLVVLLEQVHAEVPVEIAPDGVNVVCVVLCVVVLDEERGSLQPVVVAVAPAWSPHPREADGVQARGPQTLHAGLGNRSGLGSRVLLDDREQKAALLLG